MKILFANKFYYRRGGDCVCTIVLEELFKVRDTRGLFLLYSIQIFCRIGGSILGIENVKSIVLFFFKVNKSLIYS